MVLCTLSEFEPKQPQLEPKPMNGDGISLRDVRPPREAEVLGMIPEDGFETYEAGSNYKCFFSRTWINNCNNI